MPQFKVQAPDGSIIKVDAPDGATEQQAIEFAASQWKPAHNFIDDMSGTQKFLAGAGKAFYDTGRGIGEILGVVSPDDVEESKKRDAPLMKTGAGLAGNITGEAAILAPTALIPGANTYAGGAAIGAAVGAAQPITKEESRLKNAALGALGSTSGKFIGDKAGKYLSEKLVSAEQLADKTKAQRTLIDDTINNAQMVGYVLPPTQANPSKLNKILEGASGKIQTSQKASLKNQDVTNNLVKQALGISEDAPITKDVLDEVRKGAGEAYDTIKRYGSPFKVTPEYLEKINALNGDYAKAAKEFPDIVKNGGIDDLITALKSKSEISPESAIEVIRKLRFDAKTNLRSMDNPDRLALGIAQRKAADAVEGMIEQNISKTGDKNILRDFRKARELIAKSYDVEAALNESTGNVSARYLGKLLDKGKPLSGELKTVAQFARSFPKAAQDVEKIGSQPGFSPLDLATGVIAGAHTGKAAKEIAGALVARPAIRSMILSRPYQNSMAGVPSYSPSSALSLGSAIANSDLVNNLRPALLSEALTQ